MSKKCIALFIALLAVIALLVYSNYQLGNENKVLRNLNTTNNWIIDNLTIENDDLKFQLEHYPCDYTRGARDSAGGLANAAGESFSETGGAINQAASYVTEKIQQGGELVKFGGHLAGFW